MTDLGDGWEALLEWIEPRATEVLLGGMGVAAVSLIAGQSIPEGTIAGAIASTITLAGAAGSMLAIVASDRSVEACDVCGHGLEDCVNYCSVCGSPIDDEEHVATIAAARAAAREEAREVAGEA